MTAKSKSLRNTGIGHLAARSLLEEIAGLRDDIHRMSVAIADIDVSLTMLFAEMRHGSSVLRRYSLPPDAE